MDKRLFGQTGYQVAPLGFGGAPIGFLDADQKRVGDILNLLLDSGVNLIDTAAGYAGSEQLIGNAIGHRRDEFVLVSKCGAAGADADAPAWSPQLVKRTIDESLLRLKTDHLDVMLLHTCDLATLQAGEALGALVEAREVGKIRFAGYSGDNEAAAYAVALPDIAVLETSVNIVDQSNIDSVLPLAQKHRVGVIAKRPIANAAWKNSSDQPGLYQDYVKTYAERLPLLNLDPNQLGVEGPLASAWLELALRFTLGQPGVDVAIIGTTNPDNARRNIELVEKGPLPAETVEKIRASFRSAAPNGKWDAQG